MRCENCSAENPQGANFCIQCATPFPHRCQKCGFENPSEAKFCAQCAAPLAAAETIRAEAEPRDGLTGERRQLTVMFCDVVGSTPLSEQLDPEELRELMRSYQEVCVRAITSFDGYVAQYLGDGLLAYFGYPAAHEDDAVRAARAGLAIVEKLRAAQLSHPIHVRVGIHTGLVIAGEMGGGDYPEHRAIVGETPNFAARLQEQALPDTVVISPATYRLVAGLFECEDLGQRTLKGISSPSLLYRVVRESEAQSRFEVAVKTGLTPLVGREHELGLLRERWQEARQGKGQVVLLSGEPGIGKSRLVQTLGQEALTEGATRIEFRCSPYHRNSAFYPIIDHLHRFLGFQREEPAQSKLDKLTRMLAAYRFTESDTLPLLASLLSLPHPANAPPITLSPQKQKEKTRAALVAWTIEEAEKAPVYYVWEDLHWADPSSLEGLPLLLDQVPATRLLAVFTFRPDFRPPWPPRSHITQLMLTRLGRREVEKMVGGVTGGKRLPVAVMQEIVSKTDGVPLFVEELTRTVMESGVLREQDGHYELTSPRNGLAIPSSLNDSLMARLDRLGAVKEVAQLAATVGREFSYELLEALAWLDATALKEALEKLVESDILHQRGLLPQSRYIFRHALIRDAAYQSLLRSTRKQYHKHIAQTLAERFPEIKETQPELLAHHYTEAGLTEKAAGYWLRAGQQAVARSAMTEACSQLQKGLDLLTTLPDSPWRRQRELELQIALGRALIATRGYSAPAVFETFARARALAEQLDRPQYLVPLLHGQWAYHLIRSELRLALSHAEQVKQIGQARNDVAVQLLGHFLNGMIRFYLGEFVAARAHFEHCGGLGHPAHRTVYATLTTADPHAATLAHFATTLALLGHIDQARTRLNEVLSEARQLGHAYTQAMVSSFACLVEWTARSPREVQQRADEVVALSNEHDFPTWLGWGMTYRGWSLTALRQEREGLTLLTKGLTVLRATGTIIMTPYWLMLLADAHAMLGEPLEGLNCLAEAAHILETAEERFEEAELYRLRGELLNAIGEHAASEQNYHQALAVARRQSAKVWELRASTSLARLWRGQGKRTEASNLLAPLYGWFTEGFDTPDLTEAKALLDSLR